MDTLARIKDLAGKEFSLDASALDPAAPLDKLGIDFLSFIEFLFKVEEELGVGRGAVAPPAASPEDVRPALCGPPWGIARLPAEIAGGSGVQVGARIDWQPA